jgi:hypothetical protein
VIEFSQGRHIPATSGDQVNADPVPDQRVEFERVELEQLLPASILDTINERDSGITNLLSDRV